MWAALLKAAMEHHVHHAEHGTQTKIAVDAGVTKSSVSEWKRGTSYPEDKTLMRLAERYGVSTSALTGEANEAKITVQTTQALRLARELTSMITLEVYPKGSAEQILEIMSKAHDLVAEGRSEDEAYGILFRYALSMRKAAHNKPSDNQPT